VNLLLGAVDLRVADVVAREPDAVGDDEDRALAVTGVAEGLLRGLEDGLDVLPVHGQRGHTVGVGPLDHVFDGQVLRRRRRLRVAVVLADEHGRDGPELREVQRLVERADVRGPVAEEGDRDARLGAQLERQGRSDDARQPAAHDGVRSHVAALDVVQVHGAAVAVAAALDLAVELGHHLVGMRALGDRVPVRAVRGGDHVALVERPADTDRDRLLADGDVEEAG
jgi:hypothetical protein